MPNVISFTVLGECHPQQAVESRIVKGKLMHFPNKKSAAYRKVVQREARPFAPKTLIQGPVSLTVKVYRSIPVSFSKKDRALAISGALRPTPRPDLKNYIWGIEDALNGIMWVDDGQIVDYGDSGKWYSETPRVEVTIRPLADAPAMPANQLLIEQVAELITDLIEPERKPMSNSIPECRILSKNP